MTADIEKMKALALAIRQADSFVATDAALAAFHASACPAAVLELIAEVERLRAAVESLTSSCSENAIKSAETRMGTDFEGDVKCAAHAAGTVEKDADRYRWLREKAPDVVCSVAWSIPAACNYGAPDEAVDAAIDHTKAAKEPQ